MQQEMEEDAITIRRLVMTSGVDGHGAADNKSVALDHIHGYYKQALCLLPDKLIPSLLEGGFCFGFLDPVSNIIANTNSHELDKRRRENKDIIADDLDKRRENKKRSRAGKVGGSSELKRTAISKIITKSSKSIRLIPLSSDSRNTLLLNSSIAARSLRGLATFLTSYFRYLTTWDALYYLSLSKADLLVAVHIIQEARHTHTFTFRDDAAKIALGCAAISALHPAAAALVSRSFLLATRAEEETSNLLETESCISHSSTEEGLSEFLIDTSSLTNQGSPMQQAITRLQHMNMKAITRLQQRKMVGAGLQISLKMVLLDKIHLLYLEAISHIPKHELCTRHHRGLLKAGHCYGPYDPVTNIIVNTIWYDTTFPPKKHFEVAMIFTKSLARIEFLSLCGLVAYICVRFPACSVYEAMRLLLICNARLDSVIEMAKKRGHDEDILFSESVAYGTAARAANHPSPAVFVEFATTAPEVKRMLSSRDVLSPAAFVEFATTTPEVKWMLFSRDVLTISENLSQESPPSKTLKKVRKLSSRATKIISANLDDFKACQGTLVKMVEAALSIYAKQSGGQEYELHVICGVNFTIPEYGVWYCPCCYSYPFSHVNILARRKGHQYDADQVPTLFFIQCSNSDEDMQDKKFLCCPISDGSKDAGRCYHCEYDGIKIIHPSSETYLGRSTDFEDMARGESMDINRLVEHGQKKTLFDGTLEHEDSVYFDPVWDVDFSRFIDQTARDEARREKLRKEQHPDNKTWRDNSWITICVLYFLLYV